MSPDSFKQFGLQASLLSALSDLGYERATPIQEKAIPVLLSGSDLLAQAETGTGKTAAFALPILSKIDFTVHAPQALVLVPTRELAIQVAQAFQSYAKHLKKIIVAPIYGGQDFRTQFRLIKQGAQIIVGTPGRLMDHLRRESITTTSVKMVVLDEADEMLNMGFIDDVEWILEKIPKPRQIGLFSATISDAIQKIAHRYLTSPQRIQTSSAKKSKSTIAQFYVVVSRENKFPALVRLLQAESCDGVIIFARTKTQTVELAERLQKHGFSASPLNGDMSQSMREKMVDRFRKNQLNILVATDVAARGIDVERVSHVINYDIPMDAEIYVHRIGRTGRAGRSGKTILLVTQREQGLFRQIERYTQTAITPMQLPDDNQIREIRAQQLLPKINQALKKNDLASYEKIVHHLMQAENRPAKEIAAALLMLSDEKSLPPELAQSEFESNSRAPRSHENRRRFSGSRRNNNRNRKSR